MKKWKKLLIPAMCVFMLQTPVIASADATVSGNAASVITNPVATPAQAVKNGIYTELRIRIKHALRVLSAD